MQGHLPPVWLIEADDPVGPSRPRWFRSLTAMMIAVFFGTTVLTALRHLAGAPVPVEQQQLR